MATKKCGKCGEELSIDLFSKHSGNVDGLQRWCKKCYREYDHQNRTRHAPVRKKYREAHKKEARLYHIQYRAEHKSELYQRGKLFRETNKEKLAQSKLEYERKKMSTDPSFKLRKRVSLLVRMALNGNKSNFSILQYLPYSMEELKKHLEAQFEPWMSWDNWGVYDPKIWNDNDPATWTWQLDHVIPQCDLPYGSMKDENFRKCWALSNLRPLSAKQNVQAGAKTRKSQ